MDQQFSKVKKEITLLKTGQEEIWIRMDNVPFRFEHNELEKRIITLEDKYKKKRPKK